MESSVVTSVFLPLALGIIMLGLGLSLTIADFKRVVVMPKAILVGLVCQMLILPFVCYGIAKAVGLPPALAVGLMLLAASPGGATANLFSHLAKGDVALNITLTAVNSVLSVISLPIIVNLSMKLFMQESTTIPLQVKEVMQVFAVVLVPTGIGMLVRAKNLNLALRMEKPVRIASAVFLVLIIAAAVAGQRQNLVDFFKQVGIAALLFNLASMGLGYLIPRLVRLSKRQSIAIGMEVGIHNGTLAIVIATTLLNNPVMSIPPAIYSLIMFFTAAGFAFIVNRSKVDEEPAAG